MTQPDRRHSACRARLASVAVVAAALAAWAVVPWRARTFLQQQSLTALASLDPQQVRGFIAAWPQAALVSFLR